MASRGSIRMRSDRVTQVVLETVAGLVGVGKASIEWSCLVGLEFLFHLLRHLQLVDFSRSKRKVFGSDTLKPRPNPSD